MAINIYEKLSEKSAPKSSCSKSSNLSSCLIKLDYNADGSTTSSKNDSGNKESPYLRKDKVQMHTRVTERKLIRKKTDFVSSFPLAVNIYKANSDEFKVLKRGNKKIKKSVLTLPNDPAPVPQMCTVSDVNDSEYFNENKDERKPKPRKKRTMRNEKKTRKGKSVDVYDRDARYCSQLDIDLDSSSTDFINQFTGDGKKQRRRKVPANKTEISAHDVWAILRNLNQFQFVPSQPMSQGSLISVKKKTNMNKIRSSCRDARLIETCRTEEFAYISSFVDTSHSQSSLDRITVIEKNQNDYQEICKEIEKSVENCKSTVYRPNQKKTKSKATRKLHSKGNIGNNRLQVNHQQSNNNCPTDKDQRNEIGLKIKSGIQKSKQPQNNQDDKLCGDFNSCQTFNTDKTNKYNTQDENKLHRNRSKIQINGITKVVLSKGNNIDNKKNEVLRKTAESLPVAVVMPKLNAEIPQEAQTSEVNEIQNTKLKRGKLLNHSNLKAANNGEIKPNKFKHYYPNAPSIRNKLNDETKLMFENNVLTEVEPEIKQKRQLRDKMLQFLYKKHQGEDDNIELTGTKANTTENKQVEVGTNTQINSAFYKEANQSKVNGTEIENTTPMLRRTRTKGKWASDFIECVIKKIRSGVYYNNEKPLYKGNCNKREDSSQTDINTEKTFIQMNYPDHTKPQYLKREELIKTLPSHNSPTIKREIINNKQLAKELSGTDAKLHNKSNLHVQTSKGRSKNVNFEDIVYNTQINFNVSEEQNAIKQNETVKDLSKVKQSWVEGKWASDFIDNVFKKIKSGVYYTQDEHGICRQYVSRIKDDSSQTDNNPHKWNYDHIKDLDLIVDNSLIHDSLMLIPGFDNVSNELEIETFSKKQITVKNCVTNVVVQFDVALPSDPCQILRHKQSFSCIPLAVTESHTTIFKSKTTIINAFLPAELCSILPKMMRRIIAANAKFSLPKLTVGKIDSNLSTISELTRCESSEFAKQITYDISEPRTSDKLLNIKSIKLFDCIVKPMILLEFKSNEPECIQINNSIFIPKRSCMALQLYQPLNKIIPAYKPFNLEHYIENLINIKCLNLIVKMPTNHYFKIRCYNKNITISVGFQNEVSNINVKIMLSNISMDTLCNNFKNSIKCAQNNASSTNELKNGPNNLDIDTEKTTPTIITENRRRGSEFRFCNSKNKKKSFARLYKKCSSMSNLSNRSTVSIDKISNTDEFVQALGSSKILSTVIDGHTERKILVSLKEMKNWMTDITPRQALLVLLLANKKDTPNVVRYRPVVLQGIAVSRITRASELDMEIEVIERENLNKLKEFEGISYLPASVENQDTLLEELYWIAKTTASDYQRPFDESSERLLKSLLEKRKKLNPSYLRVMARYVGLGLLKSPK